MKKVFQSIFIVIFIFGFYQGSVDIHDKYTREYFVYVGEILSIGNNIMVEESTLYVNFIISKINNGISVAKSQMAYVGGALANSFSQEDEVVIAYEEKGEKGIYLYEGINSLEISSDSYLITDLESGRVLLEKDSDLVYSIASLSKLMTALVSVEELDQSILTTISDSAIETEGYAGNLIEGERFEIKDLLYPLLLESSNDAAEALAEVYNRTYFLRLMNEKAKDLGLEDTKFEDPSGLSKNNISTAKDLFKLIKYINDNERSIFDITMLPYKEFGDYVWYNNSSFINDDRYIGSKNGYTTEAEKTLVLIYKVSFDEYERPISIILLHGTDSRGDVEKIIEYLENVEYIDVEVVS